MILVALGSLFQSEEVHHCVFFDSSWHIITFNKDGKKCVWKVIVTAPLLCRNIFFQDMGFIYVGNWDKVLL